MRCGQHELGRRGLRTGRKRPRRDGRTAVHRGPVDLRREGHVDAGGVDGTHQGRETLVDPRLEARGAGTEPGAPLRQAGGVRRGTMGENPILDDGICREGVDGLDGVADREVARAGGSQRVQVSGC